MNSDTPRRINVIVASYAALILLAVAAVFYPATGFEFLNFDDPNYISQNPVVAKGLSSESFLWAWSDTSTGHWHPLTWLSLMLDVSLFGVNPHIHHAVNIALHGVSSALLFLLFQRTTSRPGRSLVAALVFALHPLRIESVVWITERKDVLSMCLTLLTLHSYVSFVRRRDLLSYLGILFLFTLSLLAKPTSITLPALLLLFDLFPLQRLSSLKELLGTRRILFEKAPLVLISVAFSAAAIFGQASAGGLQPAAEYPIPLRVESCLVSYVAYLGRLFFPLNLGIFYPFQTYPPGVAVGAFLALCGASAWVASVQRARPYVVAGWLWFLISLLPLCGLVQIGGQALADRWTYLPHIGLIVAAVWYLGDTLSPRMSRVFTCVVPSCLAAITLYNLPAWRDSEAVFRETLRVSPDNFMAHTNLGQHYHSHGDIERARPHFEAAARLRPAYPEALNNLALTHAAAGRINEALPLFSQALAIQPSNPTFRYNVALSLSHTGRSAAALAEWITLLKTTPDYAQAAVSARAMAPFLSVAACSELTTVDEARGVQQAVSVSNDWKPPMALVDILELAQSLKRCLSNGANK